MEGSSLGLSVHDPSDAHVETTTLASVKAKGKKRNLELNQEITKLDNENLKNYVANMPKEHYEEAPKKLQINTVCNLARGYHSFVLAGTGYGKSRIGELYFHMYAPQRKPCT
jgi:superfamily II RNA helicase